MNYMIRVFFSGVFGLAIVLVLFLTMLWLINHDNPNTQANLTKLKISSYQKPAAQPTHLMSAKSEKQQKEKPQLKKAPQAPNLEVAETGEIKTGQGINQNVNSLGNGWSNSANGGAGSLAGYNGLEMDSLDTAYLKKIYDENFKFPDRAIQAGITEGTLLARAVFDKRHNFLRFEIMEENPPDSFRDVLYQLKFPKYAGDNELKSKFTGPIRTIYSNENPAPERKSGYYLTLKFVFNLNDSEKIKLYADRTYLHYDNNRN